MQEVKIKMRKISEKKYEKQMTQLEKQLTAPQLQEQRTELLKLIVVAEKKEQEPQGEWNEMTRF